MCGIVGIYSAAGVPAKEVELEGMLDTIRYRGPDGRGVSTEGPMGLGHVRLSIIDVEGGSQPMESATRRSVIAYNGEIYNFHELRQECLAKGFPFRTHSDTEVILAMYETQGLAGIERLSGMYAFGLWDRVAHKLVIARDSAGIKPIYTTQLGGRFVFASELKALLAALPTRPDLDPQAVNSYFTRQYVGAGRTIYQGIRALSPGTVLVVDSDGVREHRWWSLNPRQRETCTGAEAVGKVRANLESSVKRHLVSDVPVGVFLSGGIDSSLLLALASKHYEGRLATFSVGFGDDQRVTETEFARQVAAIYGSRHHEIHVSAAEGLQALDLIVKQLDQPFADYAIVPTYLMSRFAGEHVKVLLGGEGADELFGGYPRYKRRALLDALAPRPVLEPAKPPPLFDDRARSRLLGERALPAHQLESETQRKACRRRFAAAGRVNAELYMDLVGWLVDDLLLKVDNMGMLASVETRVPYLDPDLIRTVMAIEGNEKVSMTETKLLLRRVARDLLPSSIVDRRKQGFTVPVASWLTGPLRDRFEDLVFSDGPASDWLNLDEVARLWRRLPHDDGLGLPMWSVFVFSWWAHEHLNVHRSPMHVEIAGNLRVATG